MSENSFSNVNQDLGSDFVFERDPLALASILNDGGLTPALEPRAYVSTLTPAGKLPRHLKLHREKECC